MSVAAVMAALAVPPSSPNAPPAEAVILKTDVITFAVPSGASTAQAEAAVAGSLTPACDAPVCTVTYRASGRRDRQALEGSSFFSFFLPSFRRALQSSGSFEVARTLNASSTGTSAPTVSASALRRAWRVDERHRLGCRRC